ncbi:hypothetical protein LB465_03045 [Salegentibacter sp. LM13S]|uniref:alpha/beta hydrolase n=1 Tax=Salegentibacter lacus TaxID=2873599 RepID=UPI001CC9F2F7|nr:alpha/beta hydrolase-fold protein [Salegentibacter lacus]MBZ9629743.1 hypothetical protein [Salegentibacter lacus]
MKKISLIFLSIIILSCSSSTPLKEKKIIEFQKTSELQFFQSKNLDHNIPYKVILPEKFQSNKDSLSLLVLLDGDDYSGIAQDVTSLYEFGDKIYPTVILSLPSTKESRWAYYTPTNDTTNVEESFEDLYSRTGKFPQFADFLGNELIPSIEKELEIKFKQKTIFGHSLGGLGVLSFAVIRPELFQNYISASPSTMYDQHFIFKTIEEKGSLQFDSMFLTAGLNDGNGYRENVEWLKQYLDNHKLDNQNVGSKIYENESHATSGLKTLIDGLEFIGK